MNQEGGLTAGERFDRIEVTLLRIEGKIGDKVEREEYLLISNRVSLLEAGETPLARTMINQFSEMQHSLSELTLHGSQHAQEAMSRIGKLESETQGLEKHRVALSERESQVNRQRSTAFRTWTLVLSAMTTLAVLVSTASAVIVLLAH